MEWQNRAHFFALAAQLMRRILVDFARSRGQHKRGGALHRTSFDEALVVSKDPDPDLVSLNEALNSLAAIDPRKAQVVELRFFGGLGGKEIGHVLNISVDAVQRDWKAARDGRWLAFARTRAPYVSGICVLPLAENGEPGGETEPDSARQ